MSGTTWNEVALLVQRERHLFAAKHHEFIDCMANLAARGHAQISSKQGEYLRDLFFELGHKLIGPQGTAAWNEMVLLLQRGKARLNPKHHQFIDDMANHAALGRGFTPRQHQYLHALLCELELNSNAIRGE